MEREPKGEIGRAHAHHPPTHPPVARVQVESITPDYLCLSPPASYAGRRSRRRARSPQPQAREQRRQASRRPPDASACCVLGETPRTAPPAWGRVRAVGTGPVEPPRCCCPRAAIAANLRPAGGATRTPLACVPIPRYYWLMIRLTESECQGIRSTTGRSVVHSSYQGIVYIARNPPFNSLSTTLNTLKDICSK
jgi:hypothetical protein